MIHIKVESQPNERSTNYRHHTKNNTQATCALARAYTRSYTKRESIAKPKQLLQTDQKPIEYTIYLYGVAIWTLFGRIVKHTIPYTKTEKKTIDLVSFFILKKKKKKNDFFFSFNASYLLFFICCCCCCSVWLNLFIVWSIFFLYIYFNPATIGLVSLGWS